MTAESKNLHEMAVLGAATIHEAQGKTGALSSEIKPLDPQVKLSGRALTVKTRPGDNLALHRALLEARPGDVLIVDAFGHREAGAWGGVLSAAAMHAGISGFVINGAVRDADAIIESGFPVFAKTLSIKGTAKSDPGIIGEEITIDGVTIQRGDAIIGDRDGVVIVPTADIETVKAAAEKLTQTEVDYMEKIKQGERTLDLLGLR